MDENVLMAFRDTLLRAGIPFRRVRRQIFELRDHYQELRSEARRSGLDMAAAEQWAQAQLGSLREIATRVALHCEKRSLWHRLPRLMPLMLPTTVYIAALFGMVLAMAGVIEATNTLHAEDLATSIHRTWMEPAFASLLAFLLHGLTPLLGLLLIRWQVRQQVTPGYWVAGVFLLCALGSSTHMSITWPEHVIRAEEMVRTQGVIQGSIAHGWRGMDSVRLLLNLVVSYGMGWFWWRRHHTLLLD